MDKIEKPSDELNHFISRVCISPGHAASFMGLDKLYHFSFITIKELRNWVESNLSYSLYKLSRRNFEQNEVYAFEIYS